MGGLNTMPLDAPFPSYRDVDLNIVRRGVEGRDIQNVAYQGLMVECGFFSLEEYHSPEAVLASIELAPNLAEGRILSDPTGLLVRLQPVVTAEYAQRRWVAARCEDGKKWVRAFLGQLQQATTASEIALQLDATLIYLSGPVAVAHLRPPTHRRGLVVMRELLQNQGRLDLQEKALQILGCDRMDPSQVEGYLQDCAATFDRAVEIYQTPIPYGFKLQAHVRPYFIEGAQEMIDEGYHREAMSWIMVGYGLANTAIQNDAPLAEKRHFQAGFDHLLADLGLTTTQAWSARCQEANQLVEAVLSLADEAIAGLSV